MLSREIIIREVNKVIQSISNQLLDKLNTNSNSFQIGSITKLWKDSKDIDFVKQSIGHRILETISTYVNKLSDQERKNRISQLEN